MCESTIHFKTEAAIRRRQVISLCVAGFYYAYRPANELSKDIKLTVSLRLFIKIAVLHLVSQS